jgi:ribosomal protein S5
MTVTTDVTATFALLPIATTTTLASSVNPSISGQSVTFTATVASGTPTGTVTFKDGTTTLCNAVTLAAAQAQCATAALAVGSHSITAEYSGDSAYAGSTSDILAQSVQSPSFTLSVNKTGNGTVTSSPAGIDCGATCGAAFVQGTIVTLSASPAAGSSFSGWSGGGCAGTGGCTITMSAATTVTATFTLLPTATTTALASSVNPSISGQSVTFTATVASGTPTGTVTFKDGSTTLCNAVTLAAAQAQCASSALAVGSHSITAQYSGDSSYAGSTSNTVTQTVQSPSFTLAVNKTGNGTVTSSPAGIDCGATCSASYTGGTLVTLSASPANGSAFSGWSGGGCSGTGGCTVTMSAATTVTATFTLLPTATTTTLASSVNPSISGQSVTFTATVAGGTPTGTVTFKDGSTTLCNAVTLAAAQAQCATALS